MKRRASDPVFVEVAWSRLISVVEQEAQALLRTAFTNIVRESGDLSAGVFDLQGRMVAQAITGTPGHINSMALAVPHVLRGVPPATLVPGDVLATNDPWLNSGHLNDITVVTPVRLPSDKWVELKAEAEELGVGASTLIRMWVLEKLRATRRAAAPPKRASTKSKAVNKRRSA